MGSAWGVEAFFTMSLVEKPHVLACLIYVGFQKDNFAVVVLETTTNRICINRVVNEMYQCTRQVGPLLLTIGVYVSREHNSIIKGEQIILAELGRTTRSKLPLRICRSLLPDNFAA